MHEWWNFSVTSKYHSQFRFGTSQAW
jgi:hypothetical protein